MLWFVSRILICVVFKHWNHKHCTNNFSYSYEDHGKWNCISRRDKNNNKFFEQNEVLKKRWNLYLQITVENDTLQCKNESYNLSEICHDWTGEQVCTLQNTNEVVDIGSEMAGQVQIITYSLNAIRRLEIYNFERQFLNFSVIRSSLICVMILASGIQKLEDVFQST